MNISSIDLNLLNVLHAVLEERSATRAAKRLHVTQSAVSNALARLRELFQDPLLVRHAHGLSPTPRAQALAPELARALTSLSGLLSRDASFDPTTTCREFTIASADYCGALFAPTLAALLHERAPGASLRFVPLEQLVDTEGLASKIDVHVGMPPRVPTGCRWAPLFEDSFVCLVKKGGGSATPARRMTLKEYTAGLHVRVSVLGSVQDPIDVALAKRGARRRIVLTVPQFSILPGIVAELGYVATLSRRLAELQARSFAVALREPPLALGHRHTRLVWHERSHADEGARFFRSLIQEVCAS